MKIAPSRTEARERLLTPEAIRFLVRLSLRFEPQRRRLLAARHVWQLAMAKGWQPNFPVETADVRAARWRIAAPVADLQDRRVEMAGQASRDAILEGLNSGARVFIADLEDATSPTWENILQGHDALCDAARGTLAGLCEIPATLMLRPRGWLLVEKHFQIDGEPMSASLFDFGLFFFHNARVLIDSGTGPYFSLGKLESHYEARLWNDVFIAAQEALGISRGIIRAAAAIENIPAAFEMEEILWELREHSAGLSFGRWGYICSYASIFHGRPERRLPDRADLNMNRRFLSSCAEQMVAVCHKRGAHAIGGLSYETPEPFNLIRVRDDKLREVWAGFDGTQVAHAGLVPHVTDVFDTYMPFPHQLDRTKPADCGADDLLCHPAGDVSEEGLAAAVEVGLRYLAAWLRGQGQVVVEGMLENAATVDLCIALACQRAPQLDAIIDQKVEELRSQIPSRDLALAARMFREMTAAGELTESISAHAYSRL